MMKIGTSGFRGIIGDEFTKANVEKISQCICEIIKDNNFKKEVVVGYDNRFMSEVYAQWIGEILAGNGIQAKITARSVSTPVVSFATKMCENDFGIMVTASHNPYYYNGLKVFFKEGKEVPTWIEEILNSKPETIQTVNKLNYETAQRRGLVEEVDYNNEYVDSIINLIKFKRDFKAKTIFNCMNGSAVDVISLLKEKLNLKNLDIINTNRDALFGLHGPIPNEEFLTQFKDDAIKKGYDFAFATDGDGDRIALFDEKGRFYNGNQINTLLYYFMVKEKKLSGPFIKNVSFSSIVDKLAKKLNFEVFETKVGFKNVTDGLVSHNGLIGAENSGCELKGHVFVKDGVVVYALILEILEYYQKPLSEIFEMVRKEAEYDMSYVEYSFKVGSKQEIIDYLNHNQPNFSKKIIKTSMLDGYKYYFEDEEWILIRFSGTENLIRVVVEQNSQAEVDKILNEAIKMISHLVPKT